MKETSQKPRAKKFWKPLRAALVATFSFTLLCGVIYPTVTTLSAQTLFPYEANGSVITVTLKDGTTRTFGSEHIGQNYESPSYLFGRVNLGSPSNLSPQSEEYRLLISKRVEERKEKLAQIGYVDTQNIPDELLTASGSGLDPHISPETAYFQVGAVVKARNAKGDDITEAEVKQTIDQYTEGRFLGVFGEPRVNVLLTNLALDGLL